jgi:hypothetical protein
MRFEQSGLTAREFCRQAKIRLRTFYLWRRKPGAGAERPEPGFAEVQLSAGSASCPVTLHLPGGAKLEVTAATEATWLGLGVLLKSLPS